MLLCAARSQLDIALEEAGQLHVELIGLSTRSTAGPRAPSSTAAPQQASLSISLQHESSGTVAAPLAWEHPHHAALASWHFDMVGDTGRNGAYRRATEGAVARARRGLAAGQALHVVDVGSGSGLLAMMAARWARLDAAAGCCSTGVACCFVLVRSKCSLPAGAVSVQAGTLFLRDKPCSTTLVDAVTDAVCLPSFLPQPVPIHTHPVDLLCRAGAEQVYALESLGHLADTAQRVACLNGFGASIKVVHKDARYAVAAGAPMSPGPGAADVAPPDLPARAQLAVFELFDCGCIGEGVLHVLAAVKAELLAEGADVVPARARVYCQPGRLRRLGRTHGLDVSLLNQYHWGPDYVEVELRGAGARGEWAPVSEPQRLFEFDFTGGAKQLMEAFQPAARELAFVVGGGSSSSSNSNSNSSNCDAGREGYEDSCGSGGSGGSEDSGGGGSSSSNGAASQQAAGGGLQGQGKAAPAEGCSVNCPAAVVNCMAFWFELDLGEGITLSSSPYGPTKGSTWQQAVQYVKEVAVQPGTVLAVQASHDTYSISFEVDLQRSTQLTADMHTACAAAPPAGTASSSDGSSSEDGSRAGGPKEPSLTGVPLYDSSWHVQYDALAKVNAALAKATAQDPLQFRQLAQLAVQLAARPGDHGVDAAQAAAFCLRMMS